MTVKLTAPLLALALAATPVLAQTAPPATGTTPPAAAQPSTPAAPAQPAAKTPAATGTTTSAAADAAVEAKFKALDKNSNGALEGAEAETLKPVMAQVDTNKDGKVSLQEYAAATKAGVIR